jgi:hypothetical protein
VNTVLKGNEQLEKFGKPDFQRQATLKMQGGPALPPLHA